MVFLCIACIVLSSIALHGIASHCLAFDYLLWCCMVFVMVLHGILLFSMVLHRLHGVVQLIWRAGELPHSASSHCRINAIVQCIKTKYSQDIYISL